ncbi:MAG: HAD-IA family hydrolase, partial [Bacteroidales bacterium]|nr:HAD-IA family hydrolase [Bacteroidales bacterium]
EYRHGRIEKKVLSRLRFSLTLNDFGIVDEKMGAKLGKDYVAISPTKVNLFPNAIAILDYLEPGYSLHLITNGFSEVQDTKLRVSGMGKYFQTVITSEEAGVKKPNPEIFNYALGKAGAEAGSSLMIGDDFEVDIVGARNVGIDQVLFDPERKYRQNGSTFVIRDLGELKGFL